MKLRLLRRPLAALLVVAILFWLSGFFIGRASAAAPWSASDSIDFAPVVLPSPTGAPLSLVTPPSPRGPNGAPEVAGGAPTSPADSMQPTATVAASPESSPVLVETPAPGITVSLTWYCNATHPEAYASRCRVGYPDRAGVADLYAAVTPDLAWLDGRTFTVVRDGLAVVLRAVDRCDCGTRHVDLYADGFVQLAPLSAGVLNGARVTW